MSEEEKKAIAHLEWLLDDEILASEDEPYIEIILNLIEKLQKELNQEKEKNKELEQQYDKLSKYFIENHISKDKIKEKIEELKNGTYDAKIILQKLLEK